LPRIGVASAGSSASVGSGRPGVLMAVLWCVSGNGAAAAHRIVAMSGRRRRLMPQKRDSGPGSMGCRRPAVRCESSRGAKLRRKPKELCAGE
jgi:hypothetical protein